MTKEVQTSVKMDKDLRDQFMVVEPELHRPAAQIIRELMGYYIINSETPNVLTAETIRKSRHGDDVFYATSTDDLFTKLDI